MSARILPAFARQVHTAICSGAEAATAGEEDMRGRPCRQLGQRDREGAWRTMVAIEDVCDACSTQGVGGRQVFDLSFLVPTRTSREASGGNSDFCE